MQSPHFSILSNNVQEDSSDGTSPMTNLAKNLSDLSTNITPCRRISWGKPSPKNAHFSSACDSPYGSPFAYEDSPSFQEGVLRGIGTNSKKNQKKISFHTRKFLFNSGDEQDKENVIESDGDCSYARLSEGTLYSSISSRFSEDGSQSEFCSSQESGFCEAIFEKPQLSFMSVDSTTNSIRSNVFSDDETEEDENFFSVENLSENMPSNMSHSMSQLLTKPLSNDLWHKNDTCVVEESENTKPIFRRKLSSIDPNRYCISSNLVIDEESSTIDAELVTGDAKVDKKLLRTTFKRPEPIHESTPTFSKRRKSSPSVTIPSFFKNNESLPRCYSETEATIMRAVQKSDQEPNLIGDFSRPFSLPMIPGKHQDLKTISSETLVKVLEGKFTDTVSYFTVIDCRYPYEYEGGHIKGAENVYTQDSLYAALLSKAELPKDENRPHGMIIFHCEFSSERAPKLMRYLRSKDRELNDYPRLHHPELYLLEGGYKDFYAKFQSFCDPQSYKPMLHKAHSKELREFRSKSKSFGNEMKIRPKLRSNLKF